MSRANRRHNSTILGQAVTPRAPSQPERELVGQPQVAPDPLIGAALPEHYRLVFHEGGEIWCVGEDCCVWPL